MARGHRESEKNLNRRVYNFKQSHGGRRRFPGGEWGSSSEYGKNSEYHQDQSFDSYHSSDRFHDRPTDMDNYFTDSKYSSVQGDYETDEDIDFGNKEYNRSRFAEPYTGGQFSRSQYGTGGQYARDRWDSVSRGYGEKEQDFSGHGPKGYVRSDERIREDVCEALYRNPYVDASGIDVSVKEGHVTLKGDVESREAKREAEICIENLSGVEDVLNELRLKNRNDVTNSMTENARRPH